MTYLVGRNNKIDQSAQISANVRIGNNNQIGKNVVISNFKGQEGSEIILGDCNVIHDNTRILIGKEGLSIGDWNVFHNTMLVMGNDRMEIGHNCWFGQNTILDSTGGLFIGNGVRIGMYSQIWTHVASGELIEGCTLFAKRSTIIEDDVWLVGSCNVGSGVTIGKRAICMNGSLITKNIEANKVYRGAPAKLVEGASYYKDLSANEKMELMLNWVKEFVESFKGSISYRQLPDSLNIEIINKGNLEKLRIGYNLEKSLTEDSTSYFNMENKTFNKKLTDLEINFYKFIYDHKARFTPIN